MGWAVMLLAGYIDLLSLMVVVEMAVVGGVLGNRAPSRGFEVKAGKRCFWKALRSQRRAAAGPRFWGISGARGAHWKFAGASKAQRRALAKIRRRVESSEARSGENWRAHGKLRGAPRQKSRGA